MAEPRVVIVGGGFGGLAAAKALRHSPAHVLLIDRANHHLFQPLLYQVATSVLSPGQIAAPLRGILRKQKNTTVILAEVTGVDVARKCLRVRDDDHESALPYDHLVLSVGTSFSYFGHDTFAPFAPGLKTAADALEVRNRILHAFELAEAEENPGQHPELLTFVLVGAGPTGVEMAGAIAEMVRTTLKSDFRRIDPATTRVVLVDMAPRVLQTFAEDLSAAVHKRLEKMGVEIRLGFGVDQVDAGGVVGGGGQRIPSRTVIWTAGVTPSPAGRWLDAQTDRAGRVRVGPDLSVPGHPEIFVVGDTALVEQDGKPLPGVAQVALQEGHHAGTVIRRRIAGQPAPAPFRYHDLGNMAVVGKGFAIIETAHLHRSGFLVWLIWALVHVRNLALANLRVSVFLQWIWTYLSDQRGVRLIVEHKGGADGL